MTRRRVPWPGSGWSWALMLMGLVFPTPAAGSPQASVSDTLGARGGGAPARMQDTLPLPNVLVPDDARLGGRVRILYWDGSAGRAERTAQVLARHAELPGLPADQPARAEVVLAPDIAAWNAYTGGQVPHWGAGVAIPSLDRIIMPLFRAPWSGGVSEDRTLRHEWAHLGLHGHLEGLRIPRWFDEGYAQWASGGWDAASGWRLRVALARGSAPPLQELTLVWPRDRQSAELAYLLSASAVSYLVGESGARGMEVFLDRWQETRSFDQAFRGTFGMTPAQFESRWIEHVRRRYGWIIFLSQTAFVWGVLGIVLLFFVGVRRRRDRERLERLRTIEETGDGGSNWWRPFS